MIKSLQKLIYKVQDKVVNFAADETGTYEQYKIACRELKLNPVILEYIFVMTAASPVINGLIDRNEDNNKLLANFDRMAQLKLKNYILIIKI